MMQKDEAEIRSRIDEVEQKLHMINSAIGNELKRPFFDRRLDLCQFLDLEKRIYSAILRELKWTLNE